MLWSEVLWLLIVFFVGLVACACNGFYEGIYQGEQLGAGVVIGAEQPADTESEQRGGSEG